MALKASIKQAYGIQTWIPSRLLEEACLLYHEVVPAWFPTGHQAGRKFVELGGRNTTDNHEKTSPSMNHSPLAWT